jgi:hypothetical protein
MDLRSGRFGCTLDENSNKVTQNGVGQKKVRLRKPLVDLSMCCHILINFCPSRLSVRCNIEGPVPSDKTRGNRVRIRPSCLSLHLG